MTLSSTIARTVAQMSAATITAEAWTAVQAHLLDCLTLIVAGNDSTRVRRAVTAAGVPDPAFALSLACGAQGLDDFDEATRAHPGAMLVPALLVAAAERPEPVHGREFAVALLMGYEAMAWLGSAMDARHMHQRGRHPSAVLGIPAVAIGVARLCGPDADRIAAAIGIAAGLSCGLTEFDAKEDMRAVQTAWAASAGLRAARLADAGFGTSPHALEAPGGLLGGDTSRVPPVAAMAEAPFAVESVSFKPYSHFSDLHPATAALFRAVGGRHLSPDDVAAVRARVTPTAVARLHRGLPPRTPKEAKRSAEFVLSACLFDGGGPGATFDDARIQDPGILALAERVDVVADLEQTVAGQVVARVEISLTNGDTYTGTSTGYPGDGRDPQLRWTLDDARKRFDAFTGMTDAAPEMASLAVDLAQLDDVRPLATVIVALPYSR